MFEERVYCDCLAAQSMTASDYTPLSFLCDAAVELSKIQGSDMRNVILRDVLVNTGCDENYAKRPPENINVSDISQPTDSLDRRIKDSLHSLNPSIRSPRMKKSVFINNNNIRGEINQNVEDGEMSLSCVEDTFQNEKKYSPFHSQLLEHRPFACSSELQQEYLQVTYTRVGNQIHLIPRRSLDVRLLERTVMSGHFDKAIAILIHPDPKGSKTKVKKEPNLHPKVVTKSDVSGDSSCPNPKHIYKTISDTFRVQMGTGCKENRNEKFSRNCATEEEAFWLCEVALIIIDTPSTLEAAISAGNYKTMLHRKFVSSEEDFVQKLVFQTEHLKALRILKEEEFDRALCWFPRILPPSVCKLVGLNTCSAMNEMVSYADVSSTRKRRRTMYGGKGDVTSSRNMQTVATTEETAGATYADTRPMSYIQGETSLAHASVVHERTRLIYNDDCDRGVLSDSLDSASHSSDDRLSCSCDLID